MSGQQTTPLWQTIMHAPMPEPAKRMHIGLGEHRHVWLDSDMRHFAHQIAEPIQRQRDELLEALKGFRMWAENQADAQSKGGHASFDLLMLREQRDIAREAIAKADARSA